LPPAGRAAGLAGILALAVLLAGCGRAGDPNAPTNTRSSKPPEPTGDEPSELAGTGWELVSARGRGLPEDVEITLTFEPDDPYTKFAGRAVCNGYGGRNVATGKGEVEINVVQSSAVGCGTEGDRLERDYYDALQEAAAYRVRDGRLEIRDQNGEEVLVYAAAGEEAPPDSGV
jgi:heat shock protein HslJ